MHCRSSRNMPQGVSITNSAHPDTLATLLPAAVMASVGVRQVRLWNCDICTYAAAVNKEQVSVHGCVDIPVLSSAKTQARRKRLHVVLSS